MDVNDDDFAVGLSQCGPNGCNGHGGGCRQWPEYAATLTYDDAMHHVDLCRHCAAIVRSWPVLTSMEDK